MSIQWFQYLDQLKYCKNIFSKKTAWWHFCFHRKICHHQLWGLQRPEVVDTQGCKGDWNDQSPDSCLIEPIAFNPFPAGIWHGKRGCRTADQDDWKEILCSCEWYHRVAEWTHHQGFDLTLNSSRLGHFTALLFSNSCCYFILMKLQFSGLDNNAHCF